MIKCALQFERKSNQHCPNHYFTIIIHNSYQIKCWFLMSGENRSTRGKTSHSRVENQQTQSTYDTGCGNRTRATLMEGKCSHHQANPATLFPFSFTPLNSPIFYRDVQQCSSYFLDLGSWSVSGNGPEMTVAHALPQKHSF